jgi:benzoyl-CoA reductase/2-hydroxyglutaryl-CoA dehydratase subunit BcrC/BadD/HgdB
MKNTIQDTILKDFFNSLARILEKRSQKQKLTPRRLLVYETSKIVERIFDDKYSIALTGVFVPFEIFHSMGVESLFVEFIGGTLATTGKVIKFLEKAESAGYSTDTCAYHRSLVGAALSGIIPKPQLFVGANTPCDGGLKALQEIAGIFNKPIFTLHIPYRFNKENIKYLVKQYEEMIQFISNITGKKFDIDKLKEAIILSNRSTSLVKKIYKLNATVPSPFSGDDLKNFGVIFALLLGTKEGVDVAGRYLDDIQEKVDSNIPGIKNEKIRLLWLQNRIQFNNKLISNLQNNYGVNVVADELNYIYWDELDPENPLEELATRQINHPFNGDVNKRLEIIQKMAKEYKIDGAINPSHWGCRQNCGGRHMFKKALEDIGVPMINLDVDCVDERNFSEGQLMTRLEGFIEMLR